jgi:dUTP pyrophosphatase
MTIRVKKLVDGLEDIRQAHPGEWYDLRGAEDVTMKAGELRSIPLGVAIQLPEGFEAILASRSSGPEKFGIIPAHGIGIIDNKYCGDHDEWKYPAYAIRDTVIHKNDRICQFRILYHNPAADLIYVDTLGNPNRGGLGSTGKQ